MGKCGGGLSDLGRGKEEASRSLKVENKLLPASRRRNKGIADPLEEGEGLPALARDAGSAAV